MDNHLKCKLCGFTVLKWKRRKGKKKPMSGFDKLKDHYFFEHPEYWEKVRQYLGEVDGR